MANVLPQKVAIVPNLVTFQSSPVSGYQGSTCQLAYLQGEVSELDGGQGFYQARDNDYTTAVSYPSIIADSTGLRWQLTSVVTQAQIVAALTESGTAPGLDPLSGVSTNIAAAATTDLSTATGNYVNITGSGATITALGTETAGRYRFCVFADANTLTNNASSLILPGGANITTAAGDFALFVSLGSGNWKCLVYQEAAGGTPGTLPVSQGGTGAVTLAANGVLYGNGTSAVQVTTQGAANSVLTANAGAPSFSATPTVSAITATQSIAATTPSGVFVNTTDNASVRVLRLEGDRATPTANDTLFASWFLSDAAGNQDEFARFAIIGQVLTNGAEQARWDVSLASGGTLTAIYNFTVSALRPNANDGAALGTATLSWADLFLASGAVINFNNGDVTLTHSSNTLAGAGGVLDWNYNGAAGTAPIRSVNSTDSNLNVALSVESDRATPTTNDRVMIDMKVSDSAGNQDAFGRLIAQAATITSGAEVGTFYLSLMSAGTLTDRYFFANSLFSPVTNDQIALGSGSLSWSDLFLASGAVINWANGTFTLTQSGSTLTANGAIADPAGRLQASPVSSTAALGAIANAINTTNKFTGKLVIDGSLNEILYATGAAAGDVWNNLSGGSNITPA